MRRWLTGEPELRDILADPVIQLMMRRDRVNPDHLRAFLHDVRARALNVELPPDQHYRGQTKSTGM
ncbi:MAG TPA: hypothetical protein VN823_06120 [Stellaceae bacterium]|nr:hypothetical protein [Stellaceae bacterium]